MPYPHIHILFFLIVFEGALIYTAIRAKLRGELSRKENMDILFITAVASLSALLPDIPFLYSYILYESSAHLALGPIYTHSIIFGLTAVAFGFLAGYIHYKNCSKAVYLAILSLAAFLSHLLLDDMSYGSVQYLYPVYNKPISLFSYANVALTRTNLLLYNLAWLLIVLIFLTIMILSLYSLSKLGFEFKFQSISR
jgi:hypothetical protein